jgi:hypothetical protein
MKKTLLFIIIILFAIALMAHAEPGFQETSENTIGADATPDIIKIDAGVTGQFFNMKARTDVAWKFYKTATSTTYTTINAGDSVQFGFNDAVKGELTIGYGVSSSGDIVIEVWPFNK